MKKTIALFLSLCLILSGCGSAPAESIPADTTTATVEPSIVDTEPPVVIPETESSLSSAVTISETVVFDNGDFKLTAKEIDFSDDYNVKIKFLAENNSDSNIIYNGNYFSVNGITMYCSFFIKVAAGKKANDYLEIDRDDMATYGITDIANIKAQDAYIYNDDTSKVVTYFQFELPTSISEGYVQEFDRSGQTVYDQNGIIVKYRGIVPGRYSGEELEFSIENTSVSNIGVYVDNVSVNGFMVYGSMVAHTYPGCITYETMDFSSSDLEENDIDVIEEVSLNLYGYDEDTNRKVWESEEFTISGEKMDVVSVQIDPSDIQPSVEVGTSEELDQINTNTEPSFIPSESNIPESGTESPETNPIISAPTSTYVLNTNTHKFHYSWCSSAKKTKSSNKSSFNGTRAEVIAKGYTPCQNCNP